MDPINTSDIQCLSRKIDDIPIKVSECYNNMFYKQTTQ